MGPKLWGLVVDKRVIIVRARTRTGAEFMLFGALYGTCEMDELECRAVIEKGVKELSKRRGVVVDAGEVRHLDVGVLEFGEV